MCVCGCVFVSSYSCAKVTDFTYCLEFQEKKENKEKKEYCLFRSVYFHDPSSNNEGK